MLERSVILSSQLRFELSMATEVAAIVIDVRELAAARERLLRATVAVREAIDEECGPDGIFLSSDPEYARKMARFDALHIEEKTAWEELKRVRRG